MKSTRVLYHWTYILMSTIVSTIVLFYYVKALPELISNDTIIKETCMCSGQILWQGIILIVFLKKKIAMYLYQMITVSLLGSLALIPILILHHQVSLGLEIRVGLFFIVVCCMIMDHYRRVKKLELPSYLTATWVVYRILWLPVLLL